MDMKVLCQVRNPKKVKPDLYITYLVTQLNCHSMKTVASDYKLWGDNSEILLRAEINTF